MAIKMSPLVEGLVEDLMSDVISAISSETGPTEEYEDALKYAIERLRTALAASEESRA